MKRFAAILSVLLMLMLTACKFQVTPPVETDSYMYSTAFSDVHITGESDGSTENSVLVTENESTAAPVTESKTDAYESTDDNEGTLPPATVKPDETVSSTVVPTESSAPINEITTVNLNISMPERNGTMVVDSSSGNKFVKKVSSERKIDAALLAAVYAVPESGQNYVFEFNDESGREADDIRRVYLIDENGKITGVAAVKSGEREGISATENWVCINVLIKGVIYPAIQDEIS